MTLERGWLIGLLAATAALGIVYILVMPPGLPYDEPSHWLNVEFYLEHHRIPEIGESGVTYEAQMGPLAYVLLALAAAPFWLLSHEAGFLAARAVGLIELLALVVVTWRLAGRSLSAPLRAALLSAAVVGLNPMMLAMSTSIQNDTLAVLLAAAAVDVATSRAPLAVPRGCVVGVLVGLALLAKITMWPVAAALGSWFLWRRRYGLALAYAGTAAFVSGWWFVRNVQLYGDPTGKAGVDAAGYSFPALGVEPDNLIRGPVTYLWLPVEYVRNTVSTPPGVELLVIALTALGLLGAFLARRSVRTTGRILAGAAAIAIAGWMVTTVAVQGVAFRFAYAALPAWSVAVGGLALARGWRGTSAVLVVSLLLMNAWFLMAVGALSDPGLLEVAAAHSPP